MNGVGLGAMTFRSLSVAWSHKILNICGKLTGLSGYTTVSGIGLFQVGKFVLFDSRRYGPGGLYIKMGNFELF